MTTATITIVTDEQIAQHYSLYAGVLSRPDMAAARESIHTAYRESLRAYRSAQALARCRGEESATKAMSEAQEAREYHANLSGTYEAIRARELSEAGVVFNILSAPTSAQRAAREFKLSTIPDGWRRSQDAEARAAAWERLTERQKIDTHRAEAGRIAKYGSDTK